VSFYLLIKTLHIISATVLFGTGLGIAFFMFRSWFVDDRAQKLYAARSTVLADWCFTLPAGLVQPISGVWLMQQAGFQLHQQWVMMSLMLYILAAACWLPVVWIQLQLKVMLEQALESGEPLPARFNRLFAIWFALGWPAFVALLVIFYLMVAKPV